MSRPASIKLIIISVTKFSFECSELKNLDRRLSTKSRLAFSPNSCFFSLIIFMAKYRTFEAAIRKRYFDPIFNSLLFFETKGIKAFNLSLLILTLSSKARVNLACEWVGDIKVINNRLPWKLIGLAWIVRPLREKSFIAMKKVVAISQSIATTKKSLRATVINSEAIG